MTSGFLARHGILVAMDGLKVGDTADNQLSVPDSESVRVPDRIASTVFKGRRRLATRRERRGLVDTRRKEHLGLLIDGSQKQTARPPTIPIPDHSGDVRCRCDRV